MNKKKKLSKSEVKRIIYSSPNLFCCPKCKERLFVVSINKNISGWFLESKDKGAKDE